MKLPRVPKDVIVRCASELQTAKSYRGVPIHFGRGRPPTGQIGFISALAKRTGYSRHIIHRVLAGQPRAGSVPPPEEQRRLMGRMSKVLLAETIQRLFQVLGPHADPAIWDERQPARERLDRLVDACRTVTAHPAPLPKDPLHLPATRNRPPQDPVTITRSALLDASEAALALQADGHEVVPADLVSVLEHLAAQLQPPRPSDWKAKSTTVW